jgi:uncharacterized alpha/beta hydrolase family protein
MKKRTKAFIFIAILIIVALIVINFEYTVSKTKSKIIQSAIEDTPSVSSKETYPLLLLHGFNPTYSRRLSEFSLKHMQDALAKDLGYVNKGIFTPEITCTELQYAEKPIIIRATYFETLDLVEINEYSNNFGEIMKKIKDCTGAGKVDVLTHSMGGIVVRNYIKDDGEPVRKLIMLGTPNHGGLYGIGMLADYFIDEGESKISMDFIQLSEDHNFIQTLNANDETPGDVHYYTVAGKTDKKGDGLVSASSVSLEGEEKHAVVSCGHFLMKYPRWCPESYAFVKEVLSSE